jgi:hypothetical protein
MPFRLIECLNLKVAAWSRWRRQLGPPTRRDPTPACGERQVSTYPIKSLRFAGGGRTCRGSVRVSGSFFEVGGGRGGALNHSRNTRETQIRNIKYSYRFVSTL